MWLRFLVSVDCDEFIIVLGSVFLLLAPSYLSHCAGYQGELPLQGDFSAEHMIFGGMWNAYILFIIVTITENSLWLVHRGLV